MFDDDVVKGKRIEGENASCLLFLNSDQRPPKPSAYQVGPQPLFLIYCFLMFLIVVATFLVHSRHPDFNGEVRKVVVNSIGEMKKLVKQHMSVETPFLIIYGTDPLHCSKIGEIGKWIKEFGVTVQGELPQNRRINFMPKLEKIRDAKLIIVNPTVWYGKRSREKSQELDFIILDNKEVVHIGEFVSKEKPVDIQSEVKKKIENIHRKVVWNGARKIVTTYYPQKNLKEGNFYFFVKTVPQNIKKGDGNIHFIKYFNTKNQEHDPNEADFDWFGGDGEK